MYDKKELGFILYNNRSTNLVRNFLPQLNIPSLIRYEAVLRKCQEEFEHDKFVEIPTKDLNMDALDIIYKLDDVKELTTEIFEAHINLTDENREWLNNRGITDDIIDEYKLGSLSEIDEKHLETIGATTHPLLEGILVSNNDDGIIIPEFDYYGELINCTIRRISDIGKLKYTQACPDVDVHGLDDVKPGDEVWVVEGQLDMMAIKSLGIKAVTSAGAMWSGIQITRLMDKKPGSIKIWADNDQVGLRCAAILNKFFGMYLECSVVISTHKDPCEHILENKLPITDLEEISITDKMISEKSDESFDFVNHLKTREF